MSEKYKILLVDNRQDFLDVCLPRMEENNFLVDSANSYNEALQKAEKFRPDIVITALMLEHFDSGFVLSHKLKQLYPGMLIYILTSATHTTGIKFSINSEDERAWIKADGFLNEPMKIDDIIDIIETHLARKKETALKAHA